ncbi:MAG: choice-of-anchor D domain-containing protein [Planctomycetes bacterium]|nr:choice-of-anchor D domain-containing protein [Planctomycetota bacterium]
MCKNLKILCMFLFIYFIVSCGVLVNPIVNLTIIPESIDFGYVQVNQKVSRCLKIVNTGKLKLKLTKIELEFNDSRTTSADLRIQSGAIIQLVSLETNENHVINVEFSPRSSGAKFAEIVVNYSVNDKNYQYKVSLKGTSYEGYIQVLPALLEFNPAYVGEENTELIYITNTDTKPLTIESVTVCNFGTNTSSGEFRIKSGWDGYSRTLYAGVSLIVKLSFKPSSLNMKTASLKVNIAESHYDFSSTLAGLCCDTLEFITASKLADAEQDKFCSYILEGQGGDGRYTFSVPNNNLPKGLSLRANTIEGTPEEHGDFGFSIVIHDESGHFAHRTFILHINYAILYRDTTDVDTNYVFDRNNDTGSYIVNLIAEGDIALTINSITLSGLGVTSGEATILSQPTLPHIMQNGDRTQIVIKVESLLDEGRDVTLTVNHTGINSPFSKNFEWESAEPGSYIFVLDRSGSMSARFGYGFPVYDRNGNVIPYPNRWQGMQSITAEKINALNSHQTFDVITFGTSIYICNSSLRPATSGNKATAIAWLYNQGTTG